MKLNSIFTSIFLLAISFRGEATTKLKAESLSVDTASTQLTWHASKITGEHYGNIKVKDGTIVVKNGEIVGGKFDVDMDSFTSTDITDDETKAKLIGHLKSDDFFDVKAHQTATFEIKKLRSWNDLKPEEKEVWQKAIAEANARKSSSIKLENPTHLVSGLLTIKGKAVEQVIPATIKLEKNNVNAVALLVIDRTRWGIKYGSGKFFKGLGDKVIHDTFEVAVKLMAKK